MKLKKEQYISLFFLVFFIFIKTAGLHTVLHSNDEINNNECDICEFVVTSDNSSHTANKQIIFEPLALHNYNIKIFYKYNFQFVQNQVDTSLFSRPPPVV